MSIPSLEDLPPQRSQSYMDKLQPPTPENFERIARVQEQNEAKLKLRDREQRKQEFRESHSMEDEHARAQAAKAIQKTYRGYRARREINGLGLDATTRWMTAVREAQFVNSTRPQARSVTDAQAGDPEAHDGAHIGARNRWKKVSIVARRAGHDDLLSDSPSEWSSSSIENHDTMEQREKRRAKQAKVNAERRHEARMMGLQYFLEMVDLKHRYGSNLRTYHEEWKKSDTRENFFYWLDHGEGRNIDLSSCPRERLDREQVRYLSREERQYYLVKVDAEGRLCWAKNGARIDTTIKYKDSIHGIVPSDDPTPAFNPDAQPESPHADGRSSSSSSISSLESKREADRAAKYATPGLDESKGMHKVTHISASTIFNRLLRKSVRKNTWIFVADTSFRLYVGIKNSGAFQHSSFCQGSRISAAGLIKIKDGRLSSLSPLSGHYRPPASNFRAFVSSLKSSSVDMSHVSISRSYVVLVGLEAYIKTRKKGKDFGKKVVHHRDKIVDPEEVRRREEEERDKSESAAKERKVLEEQEREREENRGVMGFMQKLGIRPRVPHGQKDEHKDGDIKDHQQGA